MIDAQPSASAAQIDVGRASCPPVRAASSRAFDCKEDAHKTGGPETCPILSALTDFRPPCLCASVANQTKSGSSGPIRQKSNRKQTETNQKMKSLRRGLALIELPKPLPRRSLWAKTGHPQMTTNPDTIANRLTCYSPAPVSRRSGAKGDGGEGRDVPRHSEAKAGEGELFLAEARGSDPSAPNFPSKPGPSSQIAVIRGNYNHSRTPRALPAPSAPSRAPSASKSFIFNYITRILVPQNYRNLPQKTCQFSRVFLNRVFPIFPFAFLLCPRANQASIQSNQALSKAIRSNPGQSRAKISIPQSAFANPQSPNSQLTLLSTSQGAVVVSFET
jgi:hypothetical protein